MLTIDHGRRVAFLDGQLCVIHEQSTATSDRRPAACPLALWRRAFPVYPDPKPA
jgi:hypothetical protein